MKKLSEIYKRLNKNEWFEPVFVIGMSLTVTLGIVVGIHSVLGQAEISIANNKGEEYFYEGKYDEAIEEFENLQKEEEWPIWKVKQAEIYSIKGNYDKSNSLLKEAVIIRNKLIQKEADKYLDKDNEFINEVVYLFFINKEYDQAVSLGEDYILNNEEYKPLMKTMLAIYMSLNEKDNAKEIVEEYDVDKNSAYDMSVYANMKMAVGDIKGALNTLKEAFELDKDEINILNVVGQIASYNREEIINSLIELSTENDDVYKLFLAKAYSMDKDKYYEVIDMLDSLHKSFNGSLVYDSLKAQVLYNLGDESEATDIINRIINKKESEYAKYYIEATEYLRKDNYEKAFESCKKSILENSNYVNNYSIILPEIFIAKNELESIESYFRTAILKEPFNVSMIVNIGEYYKNLSQYDKASQYYELASKLDPDNAEIYYLLGMIEVNKEKYETSVEYFEKAISLDNENGKYFRALGIVYYNIGENEASINKTREAYVLNESDVLALNNAGCYYMTVEKDVWRGFSNIEAAYEEMPETINDDVKKKIINNYNKAKDIFDKYVEDENIDINIPDFDLLY